MDAAVMCTLLMRISIEDAKEVINKVQDVSFWKGLQECSPVCSSAHQWVGSCTGGTFSREERMEEAWIDCVIGEEITPVEVLTGFSCRASKKTEVAEHATTLANGATVPICHRKKGSAVGTQNFKGNIMTLETIEKASNQLVADSVASASSWSRRL